MRTERHNLYTSSIQHKLEKTKEAQVSHLCLSECYTLLIYKPTFKECLNRCSLNDLAKVQQKMHIRKKINEKTRIIYKSQQYRQ